MNLASTSCSVFPPLVPAFNLQGYVVQVFVDQLPFLSLNQQCQSTEGNLALIPSSRLALSFV